jgi:hypothetical protein
MVTIQPSELFVFSTSILIVLIASLSVLFISLPVASIHINLFLFDHHFQFCFCFVQFDLFDYPVFDYSIIQFFFSVLILKLYSKYFDPHINNHPASQ